MKKNPIFFLFIFLYCISIFKGETLHQQKKDPFLAGVLSWYFPGLGQFYSNNFSKGVIFLTGYILITSSLWIISENYEYKIGYGETIKFVSTTNRKEREKTLVYLNIANITFKVFSVIDAIKSTKDYNDMLKNPAFKLSSKD